MLLQFTNLWLSIFHVKNNVKLLDWISFLKMIPHVSFPNKNLKNFSISGSKIQAARTTTTNFTRKLATAKEFFTQKSSERCRPEQNGQLVLLLFKFYIPWLQFGFRIDRLECERFLSSWIISLENNSRKKRLEKNPKN